MWPVFHIGTISLSAYHFFLLTAFLGCTAALMLHNRRSRQPMRLGPILFPTLIIGALTGARLMHQILEHPQAPWYAPLMIWQGGYYYHGGVLGGILAYLVYLRLLGNPLSTGLDRAAPFLALGESITRIGCFCSGCCWGKPTTGVLGVRYGLESPAFHDQFTKGLLPAAAQQTLPVHPVPLYLAASMLGLFVLLLYYARRERHQPGAIFLAFLCLQSLLRFSTDFFRGDMEPLAFGCTATQGFALLLLAGALTALIIRRFPLHRRAGVHSEPIVNAARPADPSHPLAEVNKRRCEHVA